jgi:hypothetical protein
MEATSNSKVCTLSLQGPADKLLPEALQVQQQVEEMMNKAEDNAAN